MKNFISFELFLKNPEVISVGQKKLIDLQILKELLKEEHFCIETEKEVVDIAEISKKYFTEYLGLSFSETKLVGDYRIFTKEEKRNLVATLNLTKRTEDMRVSFVPLIIM